jgi:hypothetical protein
MGSPLLPTPEQTLECFRVCYELTKMYQMVVLVALDERTNRIVVIAGEETEIEIDRNGRRRVV